MREIFRENKISKSTFKYSSHFLFMSLNTDNYFSKSSKHFLIISAILFLPIFTLFLSTISERSINFIEDNQQLSNSFCVNSKLLNSDNSLILNNQNSFYTSDNYYNPSLKKTYNFFNLFDFKLDLGGSIVLCSQFKINLPSKFSANTESFILNDNYYKFDNVDEVDSLIIILSDRFFEANKNSDDLSNYFFSFLPDLSIDTYESDYRFGLSVSFTDIVRTLTDIEKSETAIKNENRDLFVTSREIIANYIYQLINYFKELEMLNFEITTENDILIAMQEEFLDAEGDVSFQELNSQKINMKNLELRLFNLNNSIKLDMFKLKSLLGFK